MTSPVEESPSIVVFGRDGKQLRELKREIPHETNNNLKHLIQAVKSLQKDTNDFLTELVLQEKSQNHKNDGSDRNAEESEEQDEDSEDEDSTSYNGSKFKKKRKI